MDTVSKLQELSSRLDYLESLAEWISRSLEGRDDVASQSGVLITTLSDDIRYRILELVTELEKQVALSNRPLQ